MLSLVLALILSVAELPEPPPQPGKRECRRLGQDETLSVDFADAPLGDVARLVSCALEKNLLFQPTTLGDKRVTVLAPKPVGRNDLFVLWRALLEDQDLVEERHGAYDVVRPVRR